MTKFLTRYNMISEGTEKKVPSTYNLKHTLTEKQDHPSLSVRWLSPHPHTSSIHGITPTKQIAKPRPLSWPPSSINFVSFLGGFLNRPARECSLVWVGTLLCTDLYRGIVKAQTQFQSPQARPSDLFLFSLHCCYNNLTASPKNAKVSVRQAAGRKRSSRDRNPTGRTCQLLV